MTPGICDYYFKSVKVQTIKGTNHCRSIIMANGVIIRTEENNPSLLQNIEVINCPDSYKIYGNIGANGVIVVNTKQTFDFVIPSQVDFKSSVAYNNNKKIYFLNGFLITNDSLRISKNAIKRTEVLKSSHFNDNSNSDSTILINIWTLTKKEVRKSLKNCWRSYD
jgi:hypothetical protein